MLCRDTAPDVNESSAEASEPLAQGQGGNVLHHFRATHASARDETVVPVTAIRFTAERSGVLQSLGLVFGDAILRLDDGEILQTSPAENWATRRVKTESCVPE
jgi:hypothetical protein